MKSHNRGGKSLGGRNHDDFYQYVTFGKDSKEEYWDRYNKDSFYLNI